MTRCCPKWNLQPGLEWKTSQAQPIRVQSNSLRGGSQTHHDIQVAQENLMILFGAGRRRKRLGKQGQYSALWYIYKKKQSLLPSLADSLRDSNTNTGPTQWPCHFSCQPRSQLVDGEPNSWNSVITKVMTEHRSIVFLQDFTTMESKNAAVHTKSDSATKTRRP